MTEKTTGKTTYARPYAKAAFEYAGEHAAVVQWSDMLQFAAHVALDDRINALINNPKLNSERLSALFLDIGKTYFSDPFANFIQILAQAHRLQTLPDVAALFEAYRAEAEKRVDVEVTSAFALDEAGKDHFKSVLEKRLGRHVTLQCHVDVNLIGGAIIRAGDKVIDGSARGKLAQLADSLSSL